MRLTLTVGQRIGLILGAALCALAARAEAQEYCVACTEPAAVYRCIIVDARPGGSQPLQTLCVTTMAKEGRHAACKVKGGTVFDCDGQVKRIPWAASNEMAPANRPAAQPPADPNQPPRTIEEMAKRANEKSTEQPNQNVDDAGKKTWRCISTFFTRCAE